MRSGKLSTFIVLGIAVMACTTGAARAVCGEFGGFAVFQCADLAYIETAPFPVSFDPATGIAGNVETRFFQIGFGNADSDTGTGSTGTGNAGLTLFNGNDNGLFPVDIVHANGIDSQMPVNSLCLRSNNWGNAGIDGCCDNHRDSVQPFGNDDILNPYYNVYYAQGFGYPGYYSLQWQQDYPMALLVKSRINPADPDDSRFFALAAVATMNRGNVGGNGPCDTLFGGGNNPAPCDFRKGFYPFAAVSNGLPNPITGLDNVVPWQEVPRPAATCVADCGGLQTHIFDFSWNPVIWSDDDSSRPSQNPKMAPADGTRATGVGLHDLRRKTTVDGTTGRRHWNGLIHFTLQSAPAAPAIDPNTHDLDYDALVFSDVFTDIEQPTSFVSGQPTGPIQISGVPVPADTCWRLVVQIGKLTEVPAGPTNIPNCRVGKCGDRGYFVASRHPATITCAGEGLIAEKTVDLEARKEKGVARITWSTTTEISMTGFDLIAITRRGSEYPLNDQPIPCTQCTTGIGESYAYTTGKGDLKGGVTAVRLEVRGGSPSSLEAPLE